jgi:hypothetical protein
MSDFLKRLWLHVYSDGVDTVVAFSEADAIKVWEEWAGDKWDDSYNPFERCPDWEKQGIECEIENLDIAMRDAPIFSRASVTKQGNGCVTAYNKLWAIEHGRGFLCSTEW